MTTKAPHEPAKGRLARQEACVGNPLAEVYSTVRPQPSTIFLSPERLVREEITQYARLVGEEIKEDVSHQAKSVFADIALAFRAGKPFEGTAYVNRGKDHCPPPVPFDAF